MAEALRLPKPIIELSVEEGGSLLASTTYYFTGYYSAITDPYYSGAGSAAADQVSIATTATARQIRIKFKWWDVDAWNYSLPTGAHCTDIKFDLVTMLDGEGDFYPWQVPGGLGSVSYGSYRWVTQSHVGGGAEKLFSVTPPTGSLNRCRYRSHPELAWRDDYYSFPAWADRKAGSMVLRIKKADIRDNLLTVCKQNTDITDVGSNKKLSILGCIRFDEADTMIDGIDLSIIGGIILATNLQSGFSNSNIFNYCYGNWTTWYTNSYNTSYRFEGIGALIPHGYSGYFNPARCQINKSMTMYLNSPSAWASGNFSLHSGQMGFAYPTGYDESGGAYVHDITIFNGVHYVITANSSTPILPTKHSRFYDIEIDNSLDTPTRDLLNYTYNAAQAQEIRMINMVLKTIRPDQTISGTLYKYVEDNRPKIVRSQVSYGSWYSFYYQFICKVTDLVGSGIEDVKIVITNTVSDEVTTVYTDANGEVTSDQQARTAHPVLTTNGEDYDWIDKEDFTVEISKSGYSTINLSYDTVREKKEIDVTLSPIVEVYVHEGLEGSVETSSVEGSIETSEVEGSVEISVEGVVESNEISGEIEIINITS